jgi:hypothetical protein
MSTDCDNYQTTPRVDIVLTAYPRQHFGNQHRTAPTAHHIAGVRAFVTEECLRSKHRFDLNANVQ